MIKAEILTNLGARHVITLADDMDFKDLAEAYDFVRKTLLDDGIFSNDVTKEYLDINCQDQYQYIRVWVELTTPLEFLATRHPAPEIQKPPTEPWAFTQPAQFLGRKIGLEALAYELNGQRFVMPMALDGRTPHDALDADNMQLLLAVNFPGAEAVIPPPVTLTGAEAYAFLVDYAEAAAPELQVAGDVNARAAGRVFE